MTVAAASLDSSATLPTLLTRNDLAALLRVTPQVITDAVADGRLPEPIRFSRRTIRWKRDEILALLDKLAGQRGAAV